MYPILYVDDEPDLLGMGKIFLEDSGKFIVDITSSASAALALLNSKKYEAVVSDYQMPDISGIDLLRMVRASGNRVPFIIFTGKGREEVVIQALNEGADFYLQKGGEPEPQYVELEHKILLAVQYRKAEECVSDHQRREADILDFLPDATFAIDTKGIVIAWNRAMEKLTGVPASAMLGKGNFEYAIPFYHERCPILIDLVFAPEEEIRAKYSFVEFDGDGITAETINATPIGKKTILWGKAVPLHDTCGTIIGAIESIRDITDRRENDRKLSREKLLSDTIIDCIPGAFFVINREGLYVRCNKFMEEVLGMSSDEICGMSAVSPVLDDDRSDVEQAMAEVLSTGHGKVRARVKGKRKSIRDFILTGRRMYLGNEAFIVGTGIEVPEKNR